jgi:hypothetical protein
MEHSLFLRVAGLMCYWSAVVAVVVLSQQHISVVVEVAVQDTYKALFILPLAHIQ